LVQARRQVNLFPLILFGSLGLHALAFMLIRFHFPGSENVLLETAPFSLVNLEILQPPPPPLAPPPAPRPAVVRKPPPEIKPEAPVEALVAENYVPAEALPAEAETAAPQTGPARRSEAAGSSEVSDYVRRNYDYIQRRIRDALRYPALARREGIQGAVQVAFIIHTDGSLSSLKLRKSSGYEVLDQAALEAVRKAAPFRKPPEEAKLVLPVTFTLR
jgi:protein TonB